MNREQGEIPQGFVWKELNEINAKILAPEEWILKYHDKGYLPEYFLDNELTREENAPLVEFSLVFIKDTTQTLRSEALSVAQDMVNNPGSNPISQIETIGKPPFITFARAYASSPKPPQSEEEFRSYFIFYTETTANTDTNTLYVARFKCLGVNWVSNQKIAEAMFESLTLDEAI